MSLRDGWDEQAMNWAAWARTPGHDFWFWDFNWPAFTALLPPAGRHTLDLGCGEGRCGRWLAEHGHRVTGVDAAPALAELAREAGGFAEVLLTDAAALPLPDAEFDLVCAFMSLQDVDDLDGTLAEVRRVLEPGGRLCAAVVHPVGSNLLGDADAGYFAARPYQDTIRRDGLEMTFHGMHHTLERYAGALRDAGLVIEDLREPLPTPAAVREHPQLAKAAQRPYFLHVLARR